MSFAVKVPGKIARVHQLPSTRMFVVSSWPMSDNKIGVWLAKDGQRVGRRWPISGLTAAEVQAWANAANPQESEGEAS